ncbi:hypothetical protein [Maribacter sp. 2308TA10-17]|uniref:hypothetical protein n=1 Tax=Maribacter sp. 2308TA10-17 TaxID=3386276 RepID=UPI0039BD2125
MFEKALQLDSKLFSKEKRIRAKRPSEYWLVFLKKQALTQQKEGYSWAMLLFLIPILVFIFIIYSIFSDGSNGNTDYGNWFLGLFVFFIFISVVVLFLHAGRKRAFVAPNAFDHLAKFIVKIKGDTFKNLIGISLDLSPIENEANSMDLKLLGLKETRQTKFKPYQLERYQANLRLKDDSFCTASLYQISLKTTTTKRRSSGKTKTKSKHKHKFYYILSLKLKASDYQIIEPQEIIGHKGQYEVSHRKENGFLMVKIKFKEKLLALPTKITAKQKKKASIFTEMMEYLFKNKIVVPKSNKPKTF